MLGVGDRKGGCVGNGFKPLQCRRRCGQAPIHRAEIHSRIGVQLPAGKSIKFGLGVVAEKDVMMGQLRAMRHGRKGTNLGRK